MKLPIQIISNLYRSALRNPKYRWGVILGSLVYLISPLDVAPDLIPLLGQIDDIALLMLLITGVSELLGEWLQKLEAESQLKSQANSDSSNAKNQTIDVEAISVE